MNESTWDRVKQIFHAAMARPVAERYPFLDDACAGETAIRAEVEELLAAHDDLGAPDTASVSVGQVEAAGATIGRYKLLQRIGEGGFGVVFMAEQQQPVRRRVALKIIKPGMDTKQVVARFEAERQALALMEHPNIAQVLDAGSTDSGRPFFVMELVRGRSITEYCDAENLNTRERLRLFVQVCHAVQHAHQKGIIHRDIKPSNVMVTLHDGEPVPKVIDFGVAKATQQRLTEKTLFTAYGQFIGTPAYVSPEQAETSGLDVDTRSDVYSLGVLLYELLIGTTPFDARAMRSAAYGEIQRMLREVEPPKPSTRLSTLGDALDTVARRRRCEPAALARLIRGDLDWIVMKALEKDRSRRYASASEFAADIVRHFDDEPIVARPPGALYRLNKLVRKHRGPVAAVSVVVITILVLGSITFWQGRAARRQATRIRQQAQQVRASSILAAAAAAEDPLVKALLLKELDGVAELPGRLRVARDLANLPLPLAVLRGHSGPVVAVDFTPDGRRIATAADTTVRIRDANGAGPPLIVEHDAEVVSVTFSPDGNRLLTGTRDGKMHIRRLDGADEPRVLAGSQATFSPDGSRLAVASNGTVSIWPADGPGDPVLLRADSAVTALAFGSGGTSVLSGHEDGTVRVRSVDGRGRPLALRGHTDRTTGIAFDADDTEGRPLATHSADGTLRLWSLDAEVPPQVFRRADTVLGDREMQKWNEVGSDDAVIFTGWLAGVVQRSFRGSTLAVSRDGRFVAEGYREAEARVRGPGVSGATLVLRGEQTQVVAAAFRHDGARVVTGHADGTARVWQLAATEPRVFSCAKGFACWNQPARSAALDPDGSRVATAWRDGTVLVRRVDGTGEEVVLGGHRDAVSSIAFGPDGARLVTASADRTARIWAADGRGEPIVLPHGGSVVDAAFSPDGSRVATASLAGDEVRVWSADGVGEPIVLRGRGSSLPIHSVAFSPDGSRLVTGGPDDAAWVWRADGIGEPVRLTGHGDVWSATFSPDGIHVALACGGGQLRIGRADGSAEPRVIHEHLDDVLDVAFSPDGTRIASASADGTVRVRRVDGSRDPLVLRGHGFPVRSVGFSADGTRVISAGDDGTARLWRVSWSELMSYIDGTVRACLMPEQRSRWLAETPAEARSAFAECENALR